MPEQPPKPSAIEPTTRTKESLNQFINRGLHVINAKNPPPRQITVVILGVARSGTSMVAHVLNELGVYMGKNVDPVVLEDRQVINLLENKEDLAAFQALVAERNQKHKVWGWKRPGAMQYIQSVEPLLRNLRYVITFRDSLAIAERNRISVQSNLLENMLQTHRQYLEMIDFIGKTRIPCLLVSYEKAMIMRGVFVNTLSQFLGLKPNMETKKAAMAQIQQHKPAYLQHARLGKVVGMVNGVASGVATGWAYRRNIPEPVELELFLDNEDVPRTTIVANISREDLRGKNIGNGNHGFEIDLRSAEFSLGPGKHVLRLVSVTDGIELKHSPCEFHLV